MRARNEEQEERTQEGNDRIKCEVSKLIAQLRRAPAVSVETEATERKARKLLAEWQQLVEESEAHDFSGSDSLRSQLFQMQRTLSAVLTQLRRRSATTKARMHQPALAVSAAQSSEQERRYLFESLPPPDQKTGKPEHYSSGEISSLSAGSYQPDQRSTALSVTASHITQRIHHTTALANQELERSKAILEHITESSSRIRRIDHQYDHYANSLSTGGRRLEQLRRAERRRHWLIMLAFIFLTACVVFVVVRRLGAARAAELATTVARRVFQITLKMSSVLIRIGRRMWKELLRLSKQSAQSNEAESSFIAKEPASIDMSGEYAEIFADGDSGSSLSAENIRQVYDSKVGHGEASKPVLVADPGEKVSDLLANATSVVSREAAASHGLARDERHTPKVSDSNISGSVGSEPGPSVKNVHWDHGHAVVPTNGYISTAASKNEQSLRFSTAGPGETKAVEPFRRSSSSEAIISRNSTTQYGNTLEYSASMESGDPATVGAKHLTGGEIPPNTGDVGSNQSTYSAGQQASKTREPIPEEQMERWRDSPNAAPKVASEAILNTSSNSAKDAPKETNQFKLPDDIVSRDAHAASKSQLAEGIAPDEVLSGSKAKAETTNEKHEIADHSETAAFVGSSVLPSENSSMNAFSGSAYRAESTSAHSNASPTNSKDALTPNNVAMSESDFVSADAAAGQTEEQNLSPSAGADDTLHEVHEEL
ncbi:hypothetical protein CCYA_CCYA12G3395 [Cyanidiococcus yangmingshanensis]|nr:hypothetical protein CCYA_CCYA12G3395 [Cyanidiococcus yangmingshanensis]